MPVFRRKQTLIGVAAVPDVPLGNLPDRRPWAGLADEGGASQQPGTFMPPGSATPKFRAPTIGKLDDKGDEGDGSGAEVARRLRGRGARGDAAALRGGRWPRSRP